ncbi:uncharacterized protein BP5553_09409 [Venustampulla echinocandica]|uniref:Uncharacterized protein n=1 Tax=Venustampulla echinocandica TaxID=2656787 RepID=A0A370TCM0_9HELO|nr:uncharacterized protein BP5553_09409 [Venustampulla echinocandica]RDL32007.1 hypothetical protein BP5553_09409 [Venustampulla echinocandica]
MFTTFSTIAVFLALSSLGAAQGNPGGQYCAMSQIPQCATPQKALCAEAYNQFSANTIYSGHTVKISNETVNSCIASYECIHDSNYGSGVSGQVLLAAFQKVASGCVSCGLRYLDDNPELVGSLYESYCYVVLKIQPVLAIAPSPSPSSASPTTTRPLIIFPVPTNTRTSISSSTTTSNPSKSTTSNLPKPTTLIPSSTTTSISSSTTTSNPSKSSTSNLPKPTTLIPSSTTTSNPSDTTTSNTSNTATSNPSRSATSDLPKTTTSDLLKTATSIPSNTATSNPLKSATSNLSKTVETLNPTNTQTSNPTKTQVSNPTNTAAKSSPIDNASSSSTTTTAIILPSITGTIPTQAISSASSNVINASTAVADYAQDPTNTALAQAAHTAIQSAIDSANAAKEESNDPSLIALIVAVIAPLTEASLAIAATAEAAVAVTSALAAASAATEIVNEATSPETVVEPCSDVTPSDLSKRWMRYGRRTELQRRQPPQACIAGGPPQYTGPVSPPTNPGEINAQLNCGGQIYQKQQILDSLEQAVKYLSSGINSAFTPPVSLNTAGKQSYPHVFRNGDPPPNVIATTPSCGSPVWEFPILTLGLFQAGKGNGKAAQADRVILSFDPITGSSQYCGLMTHTNSGTRGFFVDCV